LIQEYRGFDAGLAFYEEEVIVPAIVELRKKSAKDLDYFGAYPRFLFNKLLEITVLKANSAFESQDNCL